MRNLGRARRVDRQSPDRRAEKGEPARLRGAPKSEVSLIDSAEAIGVRVPALPTPLHHDRLT